MNSNKEVVELVKKLTEEQRMSMSELARRVGTAKSAISRYFNGTREFPLNKVEDFASALHTTPDFLLGMEYESQNQQGLQIPVLGTVLAGIPISAVEDILDYEEIDSSFQSQGEFFALRIKGDSMQPKMDDGDVVIVRQQSDANSGDTVIVLVNGDDATCKKLQKTEIGIMLVSTNPNYLPMFYSNEEIATKPVVILGKVVELRCKY
ncbi:XRE family transcriptional regulator [Gemella haemolysans]|uniref:LexA family protein n=1 Tax=Gemella haemolysans TaxID=1379 RepID=UPI00232B2DC4|nr:XRE family transcriptional regulator [Gemella haemolysans]MDB6212961.1 XRE family transcriptional regulator [Gemella haemolysans]